MIAGSLEIELMANIARLQKDMDSVKGAVDSAMGAVARSVKSAQTALVGLGTGFATALTVASFKNIVMGVVETGAALDDLRMQTGSTVEALSGLAAVGKFNNMSAEQIGGAMNMLAKNMAGATEESKGASKALEALGLDFDTFKKLRPEEQMQRVASAMSDFEDGTGKSAVAMALYGKQGAQMLPFLHDLAEVSELQANMTTEQAAAAANFDDNLTRLTTSGDAWKKELAAGMLPALDQTATALLEVLNSSGGLRDEVKRLSKDGSVAEWTRNAVNGFSYVVDAGEIVIRMIKGLGTALGGAMAATVTGVGTIAQAWGQIQGGDAFGAWDTLKSGASQVKTIIGETYSDIADLAKQPTLGANFRAAMARQVADAQNAGSETRKALDFTNVKDKKDKQEAETEFEKLVKRIKERIDAAKQEQDIGRALTDQEKFALKVTEDMAGAKKVLSQSEREVVAEMLKRSAAENEAVEQQRARLQFEKDLRAAENQRIAAYEKTVQSSADANKQLREEIEMIGLTEAQQLAVTQARMDDTIAQKEQTLAGLQREGFMGREAIALEEEIRLLRERAGLLNLQFDRTASVKQVEAISAEWAKLYDSVYQGLTDSLYRSFESGQSFFKTFWDGIRNVFKTSVLRLAIQGVLSMSGITGLLAPGTAAAAGATGSSGGLQQVLSGASSAYQVAGLAGLGGSLGFGASTGLGMTLAGNTGAALSLGAANIAGVGGAGAAAGIGTMVGAIAPYAAAAIALYSLFKKGSWRQSDGGYALGITGDSLSAGTFKEEKRSGGLFGGSGKRTTYGALDAETGAALQKTFDGIKSGLSTGLAAVGLDFSKSIGGFVEKSFDLGMKDLSPEQQAQRLASYFSDVQERMTQYALGPDAGGIGREGETAVAALTRVVGALQGVNPLLDVLGAKLYATTLAGGNMASSLQDAFGGLEKMQTAVGSYYEAYYSESERAATTTRQVTAALGAMGLSLPSSRDGFRQLVEAQDLSTESGRKTYASLVQLAPAFASVTSEVKSLILTATELAAVQKSLDDEYFKAANAANIKALRDKERADLLAQDPTGSLVARKNRNYAQEDADAIASGMKGFNATFLTQAEQQAAAWGDIGKTFERLGIIMPTTKEAFREIVQSMDTTTEAGRLAKLAVLGVGDSFAGLIDSAAAAKKAADDAALAAKKSAVDTALQSVSRSVEAARSVENEKFQRGLEDARAAIGQFGDQAKKLRSTLDGMSLAGTESEQRASAQSQLEQLVRGGGAGSIDADRLSALLSTVSKDASSQFGTYEDYALDYAKTANSISALADMSDASKTIAEQQLGALNANHVAELATLDGIMAAAQAQVDAVNGVVHTDLLTIDQSVAGLGTALAALRGTTAGASVSDPSGVVSGLYKGLLGREGDAGGASYWKTLLSLGSSVSDITSGIMQSDEYKARVYSAPAIASTSSGSSNAALEALVSQLIAKTSEQSDELREIRLRTTQTAETLSDAARGTQPLQTATA